MRTPRIYPIPRRKPLVFSCGFLRFIEVIQCPCAKSKAAINTAQKARYINPKQKQNGRAGPFERIRINESQRNDIMIKLICDKCGKDYTDEFSIPNISLNMPLLPTLVMNSGEKSCATYLCNECAKQVYNFIFGENPEE